MGETGHIKPLNPRVCKDCAAGVKRRTGGENVVEHDAPRLIRRKTGTKPKGTVGIAGTSFAVESCLRRCMADTHKGVFQTQMAFGKETDKILHEEAGLVVTAPTQTFRVKRHGDEHGSFEILRVTRRSGDDAGHILGEPDGLVVFQIEQEFPCCAPCQHCRVTMLKGGVKFATMRAVLRAGKCPVKRETTPFAMGTSYAGE